jgi:hypothetical protein
MKIAISFLVVVILFLLISGCDDTSQVTVPVVGSTPSHSKTTVPLHQVAPIITKTISRVSPTEIIAEETTIVQEVIVITTDTSSIESKLTDICKCSGNLYNCDDFDTQDKAQSCFEYCISLGKGDVHKLDSNKDGNACEGNRK